MLTPRIRTVLVALAATAGLSACANIGPYGGVSVGYGSPYGSYGSYGDPYGYGYGSGYGYLPASHYYGWYNGYYYPGTGYYVYDPFGNRFRWDPYRDYWEARRPKDDSLRDVVANWSEFRRRRNGTTGTTAVTSQSTGQATVSAGATADQDSLRQIAEARRQARIERQSAARQERIERQSVRAERQSAAREERSERRVLRRQPQD